jgi:hypothetical protein
MDEEVSNLSGEFVFWKGGIACPGGRLSFTRVKLSLTNVIHAAYLPVSPWGAVRLQSKILWYWRDTHNRE